MYAPIALKQRSDSRWYQQLTNSSGPFKELCDAQERGWNSEAMGTWFEDKKAAQKAEPEGSPSDKPPAGSSSSSATVFNAAHFDLDQLCIKYREHAETILPLGNSTLFAERTANSNTVSSTSHQATQQNLPRGRGFEARRPTAPRLKKELVATRTFSFLDLGSAPGGVSYALNKAQRLHDNGVVARPPSDGASTDCAPTPESSVSLGIGVSLPVTMGGIGMSSAMLAECSSSSTPTPSPPSSTAVSPVRYSILYGSVAEVDPVLALVKAEVSKFEGEYSAVKFDLVNGGAVADFGQRAGAEELATPFLCDDALPPLPPRHPVPWFQLFVPQLLIALKSVKKGGDIMIVYGLSDSCSLLLLCDLLAPLLKGSGGGKTSSSSDVVILPTMHFTKPPIYVYFRGVHTTTEATEQIQRQLEVYGDAEESAYKLASGKRMSDEVVGVEASAPSLTREAVDSLWSRYRQLHQYWSGEDKDAFAAAETIFVKGISVPNSLTTIEIRPQLEKLWGDRATALTVKLNKIEQMAAKRPR